MDQMDQFELSRLKKLGEGYKSVPVCYEMLSDIRTPMEVLRILQKESDHCFMLESAEEQEKWGRYTFLGFDPKIEITCIDGKVTIKETGKEKITATEVKRPGDYIEKIIEEHKAPRIEGMPPFTGGLAGYFAYDYIKYSEPTLELDAEDEERFCDVDLMLFDKLVVFDHLKQKIMVIIHVSTEELDTQYEKAKEEIQKMIHLIRNGKCAPIVLPKFKTGFKPLFGKQKFCSMVNRAKRYIYEGDIFQVVLSNRMEAEIDGSLLNGYRMLRVLNPSPYMFYFASNDLEVMGASPETLVKLEDGVLHTFPLAGTSKRGAGEAEDRKLEAKLMADEKELAEHNMLVDLGRNDLGKISRFGSVEVENYMEIQRFSHVMHIGSTVKGQIREDKDALDAIEAVLPAGTLSGAPKIRAAEIINELENNKRGIYGGAIGYIDFTGNMDTCIAIRLAYKKNGKVFIRSGAGIVADSIAEKEYEECINKAMAVKAALANSEEVF